MEGIDKHPLCILCCYSFPKKIPVDLAQEQALGRFIRQTGVVDPETVSSVRLLEGESMSICTECLSEVAKAVDKKEQVEELEGNVRKLQEELLRMLRKLRRLMDGWLEGMRGIESKIMGGDGDCLKVAFGGRRGRLKKGSWSKENVLQFREGILKVVQEHYQFREELSSKIIGDPPVVIVEGIKQEVDDTEEMEPVPTEDQLLDTEATEDFNYSLAPSDEPVLDSEDDKDEDFILPTSAPSTSKTSPRKRGRPKNPKMKEEDLDSMDSSDDESQFKITSSTPVSPPSWYHKIRKTNRTGSKSNVRTFYCTVCPKFTARDQYHLEQHLRAHEATIPDTEKSLQCLSCPLKFGHQQYFDFHLLCHQEFFKGNCDQCHKMFNIFTLKDHMLKVHKPERLYQCVHCPQVHSTQVRFIGHINKHIEINSVGCGLCPSAFHSKRELELHLEREHPEEGNPQRKRDKKPDLVQRFNDRIKNQSCSNQQSMVISDNSLNLRKLMPPSWYTATRDRDRGHTIRKYYCQYCPDFQADNQYKLEMHLRTHERNIPERMKSIQCSLCPAKFGIKQNHELHQCYHSGFFKMLCDICRRPMLVFQLGDHLKTEHQVENVLSCGGCSVVHSTRDKLLDHMGIYHHGKGSWMTCDLCGVYFTGRYYKRKLMKHWQEEHGVIAKEKERFIRYREKVRAVGRLKPKNILCPECNKGFRDNYMLQNHQKHVHNSEGLRPYKCEVCGKGFKTQPNLRGHQEIHKRGDGFQFQCHLCSKGFMDKHSFEGHMRLHEGTGLPCEVCGNMFGTVNILRSHLKTHEKVWFKCTKCESKYPSKALLQRHLKLHLGKKENRCVECNKTFSKLCVLKQHFVAVHSKEKNYKCDICDKAYGMQANLRGHKRKMHPKEYAAQKRQYVWKNPNKNQSTRETEPEQEVETSNESSAKSLQDFQPEEQQFQNEFVNL